MDISNNYVTAKCTTSYPSGLDLTKSKNTQCPKATGRPALRCFPGSITLCSSSAKPVIASLTLILSPKIHSAVFQNDHYDDVLLYAVMTTEVRN